MKLLKLNLYHQLFQFILVMKLEIESPEGFNMVVQGYNQPHKCCITSFPQLKWVSQSGQDTFYIFDLPCLFNNKTKKTSLIEHRQRYFWLSRGHTPNLLFYFSCAVNACVNYQDWKLDSGQYSAYMHYNGSLAI